MRNMRRMEQAMSVKEQRILYWQKYHRVPTVSELIREHKKIIEELERQTGVLR